MMSMMLRSPPMTRKKRTMRIDIKPLSVNEAWQGRRIKTKKYKEYVAELNERSSRPRGFALLHKEKEDVERWFNAMQTNLDFFEMINADTNRYEVPAIKEIGGELWKGKADIVGKDYIYDLKTTGNINDFKWNAGSYSDVVLSWD